MNKKVHVKPMIGPNNEVVGWKVCEFNIIENFKDDLLEYGIIIAIKNLFKV